MNTVLNFRFFIFTALLSSSMVSQSVFAQEAPAAKEEHPSYIVAACVTNNKPDEEPCKTMGRLINLAREAGKDLGKPFYWGPIYKPFLEGLRNIESLADPGHADSRRHERRLAEVSRHQAVEEEVFEVVKRDQPEAPEGGVYDSKAGVCIETVKSTKAE